MTDASITPCLLICNTCGFEKPPTEFYTHKDGRQRNKCKMCVKLTSAAYFKMHHEQCIADMRKRAATKRAQQQSEKAENPLVVPTTGRCNTCNLEKPLEAFLLHKSGKPKPPCKSCRALLHATWRAAHQEEIKAKKRQYYLEHADEIKAQSAAWAAAHPEQKAANMQQWNEVHKEERRAYNHEYAEQNAELIKQQRKEYREKNAEELCRRSCEYGRTHREIVRAISSRKRARKRDAAINDLTAPQFLEICQAWDFRCAYCEQDCKACKKKAHTLQQEHITCLAKGGNHTVQNVVPACQDCNYRKHTGPAPVWVQPLLITVAPSKSYKRRISEDREPPLGA